MLFATILLSAHIAFAFPGPPEDAAHPGSKAYSFEVQTKEIRCQGRTTSLFLPRGSSEPTPLVVLGHGQALGLSAYQATLEHLARKGIAAAFVAYDKGFFDQDWRRMGQDFIAQATCALEQVSFLDPNRVVYAGHSKGAYVAAIAAGLAGKNSSRGRPQAVVLFAPAGADPEALGWIHPQTSTTVVYSDSDTVVSRDLSETTYRRAGSSLRQFIFMRSYRNPDYRADHFWPVSEKGFFGGGPEGPLHYYGSWKWLVAAARDTGAGERFKDPYLYGDKAGDKGVPGVQDEIRRGE